MNYQFIVTQHSHRRIRYIRVIGVPDLICVLLFVKTR